MLLGIGVGGLAILSGQERKQQLPILHRERDDRTLVVGDVVDLDWAAGLVELGLVVASSLLLCMPLTLRASLVAWSSF